MEIKLPEINNISVSGRLVRDPELMYTRNSKAILAFDIANNYTKYNKETGEYTREATYFSVKMFGDRAVHYKDRLRRGSPVYIDGTIRSSSWTGKDGLPKTKYTILANKMQVLDKMHKDDAKEEKQETPQVEKKETKYNPQDDEFGDDLPF